MTTARGGDVARTTAVGNSYVGIWAYPTVDSTVTVTVTDSVASNNGYGFAATSTSTGTYGKMTVSRSTASHNSNSGYVAGGSLAVIVVSGSVASYNAYGFYSNGTFRSLGDNTVFDNTTDTTGTITVVAPK